MSEEPFRTAFAKSIEELTQTLFEERREQLEAPLRQTLRDGFERIIVVQGVEYGVMLQIIKEAWEDSRNDGGLALSTRKKTSDILEAHDLIPKTPPPTPKESPTVFTLKATPARILFEELLRLVNPGRSVYLPITGAEEIVELYEVLLAAGRLDKNCDPPEVQRAYEAAKRMLDSR